MTRLPSFVVVGQGKSGTTLIYRVLAQNPAIGLSDKKELGFFDAHFDKGLGHYSRHFEGIPEDRIVGEVSPSYLSPEPIQRLADTLGTDTKIIFILRRPIERIYARYLQNLCAKQEPGGFHWIGQRMDRWLNNQFDAISLCYDLFGPDNVLPLFFEKDLACDAPTYEAKILEHIGAPSTLYADCLPEEPVNPSVMPHYLLSPAEKRLLSFMRGKRYFIPRNHLVFCGQGRNSFSIKEPTQDQIIDAFTAQSSWAQEVSIEDYARLQEVSVFPAADKMEKAFGFDMSHWRNAPRRIQYGPGIPPDRFQKDAPPPAEDS